MSDGQAKESWALAELEAEDGGAYLVRIRERQPDDIERATFPLIVRACWRYDADAGDAHELPDDATFDAMERFETALYAAMAAGGWGVGVAVITGGGEREWLFYATDPDSFARELNATLASHPVYPLSFDVALDPEWATFADLLPRGTVH